MSDTISEELEAAGISQTAEVLKFAVALGGQISDALKDDGEISAFEAVGIAMQLFGPVRKALGRIKEVPAEIKNISPSDVELLGDVIYGDVAKQGNAWVTQCVNAGLGVSRELANLLSVLSNKPNWDNPPVAKPVAE